MTIWTYNQQEDALLNFQKQLASKKTPMSAEVKEIFKGTAFDDDPRTRARGDSGVTMPPQTGSTYSENTFSGAIIAPWESYEKASTEIGSTSSPSIKTSSHEGSDSAATRAAYMKAGLNYPCDNTFLSNMLRPANSSQSSIPPSAKKSKPSSQPTSLKVPPGNSISPPPNATPCCKHFLLYIKTP